MSNRKQHGWGVTPLGGKEEPAWRCSLEAAVTQQVAAEHLRQKMGATGPDQSGEASGEHLNRSDSQRVTGETSAPCQERVCKAQPGPEDAHAGVRAQQKRPANQERCELPDPGGQTVASGLCPHSSLFS